ncbi:MAG: diguanylate cyclase [Clostridia bacterium]|nr:diguanylate cyclase [Clostridia bacterium]
MIKKFSKHYQNRDFFLQRKAEYSFTFIIAMMLAIVLIIITEAMAGGQLTLAIIAGAGSLFMFSCSLLLIYRGRYELGVNVMIVLAFVRLLMIFNIAHLYQFYAMVTAVLVSINVLYNKKYQIRIMNFGVTFLMLLQSFQVYKLAVADALSMRVFFDTLLSLYLYFVIIYFLRYIRRIIDKEIAESEELINLAERDALTSLYNRRKITEHFNDFIEKKRVFKIILFDIDDFKVVNDTHGHNIGDDVLVELANLIMFKYKESCFARWGGEEFLMITEVDQDVSEEVRQLVMAHEFTQGLKVTVSVGETAVNVSDTIATAVKRADEAMYISKQTGKNKVTVL